MRRRRLLALGAATVGLGGYVWKGTDHDGWTATGPLVEATDQTPTAASRLPSDPPVIGGTLNGNSRVLKDDFALIERSDTAWMHAFFDVRKKYENGVSPRADPDVEALRRAANEAGVRFVVNFRWDFAGFYGEKAKVSVPEPGSGRERALFEYATRLLEAIDSPPEIIVLGNEPRWETPTEDIEGRDSPLISFTRNLKDHLVRHYPDDGPKLLLGAFVRLYIDDPQEHYQKFHRDCFEMARNDDDIDGVDLHIHYEELGQAEEMLSDAREKVPNGLITTTEFSPVWRYERYWDAPLDRFDAGKRFATRYDIPDGLTTLEYFELAKDEPRPRDELAAFYDAMPWYNVHFVEDMYDLLDEYGVSVGTVKFMLDPGIREQDWTKDMIPFAINALFQNPLMRTERGSHPHYIDDYRDRSGR